MNQSIRPVVLALLMILSGSTQLLAADTIPVLPYVEVSVATEGPLSVFSVPDGSGRPMTQVFGPAGQPVDGTITMTLYDDTPPWGDPVPFFPAEDIMLTDLTGNLAICQRGTYPDGNTDANGMTSWTGVLNVGGHAEPVAGNQIAIMVNGWIPEGAELPDLRINSPDLSGDLVVNLIDVTQFVADYFGPYNYASDFHWDGVMNLSDVSKLASAIGAVCP